MIPDSPTSWPQARKGMTEVAAATIGFALWHSLFCLFFVKNRLSPIVHRWGISYRAFFQLQSFLLVPVLIGWVLTRPARTVYRTRGVLKAAFWCAQAASIAVFVSCFFAIDPLRFLLGRGAVEPEGQGPNLIEEGRIEVRGPFHFSRHAAEWAPILLLFFTPHLKTNWLVFNVLSLFYTVLGAFHEEKRLEKRGGKAYRKYQNEVGFFFGRKKPRA